MRRQAARCSKHPYKKEYGKMFILFNSTSKTFLFAPCVMLVVFTVAFSLSARSSSGQSQVLKQKHRHVLLKQVEELQDLFLESGIQKQKHSKLLTSKRSLFLREQPIPSNANISLHRKRL